jgi:hypothetical protein
VPRIHYKFDLKGSSKNRLLEIKEEALHKEPILMDRNLISHPADKPEPEGFFPNGITVDGHDYERVKEMLERDSQVTCRELMLLRILFNNYILN